MDELQVAPSCRSVIKRRTKPNKESDSSPVREEIDTDFDTYYNQLWEEPWGRHSKSESRFHPNLCWICHYLWESKEFQEHDCHPVKRGDVLRSDLKEAGECKTFLQALLSGMAGRAGRGCGHGRQEHFEEEQWRNGPGWWNPNFPPAMYPPHP
jgi:hypothetical protein